MEERFEPRVDSRPDDVVWPELRWPVPDDTRLVGTVVEVTPCRPEHAGEVAELFVALDHDAVWAHVAGRPATPDDLAATLRTRREAGWLPWLVRLTAEQGGLPAGTVVGTSSYLDASVTNASLEVGATTYTPAVWATAVNPDTKRLLLGHAFEGLGAGRVQLKTDVRNARSQQAIARLGARFEGVLRRQWRRADGTVRDSVLFSVIAEEWPEVKAGLERRLSGS